VNAAGALLDSQVLPQRPPDLQRSISAFVEEDGDQKRLHLLVEGAYCAACIQTIEGRLTADPIITEARLNLTLRRLTVTWKGDRHHANNIVESVEAIGYHVTPFDPEHLTQVDLQSGRELLRALSVAAFASSNIMMLSLAVWAGQMQDMAPATQSLLQWISALVTLPAIAVAGRPFFRSALRAILGGHTNIDVPVAIGVLSITVMSLVELVRHGHDVYFDSAPTLLFVLLIGRYLDFRVRARSRAAIERLLMLKAHGAAVCRDDGHIDVLPAAAVEAGMIVLVKAGERVPIDGFITEGCSELDVSIVTGESLPVSVAPGAPVLAGSINGAAALRLQATNTIDRSYLAEIVRLVEMAETSRGPAVTIADRAARIWTPIVHGVALLTFTGWCLFTNTGAVTALLHAVTVLIIACPCAIGLAVPAVQIVATGMLLKQGILLRSGDALERLASVDHVAFDKTGTLSEGRPILLSLPEDCETLRTAASLAAASRHPLAQAIAQNAPDVPPAIGVIEFPGQGLSLLTALGEIRLGRASFCGVGYEIEDEATEVWLTRPGQPRVRFTFEDLPRKDARHAIEELRARSLKIAILSGDRKPTVARFAENLNIDEVHGGLTPAEKIELIEHWRSEGRRVLMMGDGLNDAPALAAAFVSASFTHGAPASQSAADIILPSDRLETIGVVHASAVRAIRIIRQNLVLAALYNIALVPLAIIGLVTPLGAAIAMSASSLTVTLNALRSGLPLKERR
jgi:Cu2+-exporting ATPase